MSISAEKIAYLRGLADGLSLNNETNEGKLFLAIVDAIAAVSSEKDLLETRIDKMGDYIDELDELVEQIAEDVYEEDDGYFDDDADPVARSEEFEFDEDDNAGEIEFDYSEKGKGKFEDDAEDGEENDFVSVICPHCGAFVAVSGDVAGVDEVIGCPTCGKPLFKNEEK